MQPILILLLFSLATSNSLQLTINFNESSCTKSSTHSISSSYKTNLNQLLTSLASQISTSKDGFVTHKQGTRLLDSAYGLALCRGDLNSNDCHACVQTASNQIISYCPNATQAILWKEQCTIRYSNESFFSVLQVQPLKTLYNVNNITENILDWVGALQNSLNNVTSSAASNESGNMFATTQIWFSTLKNNLYTLAQCTPDLSTEDCTNCFSAARALINHDLLFRGRVVLMPSCSIRYEAYTFFAQSSSTVQLPTPLTDIAITNRGKKASATKKAVAITVPLAVICILIASIFFYLKKRKKYSSKHFKKVLGDLTTVESLMFELKTLEAATNNFSDNHILGHGGFGSVYRGTLANGQEIAVKRLSKISAQGAEEFKNEVVLIANLQHRNLVKLLGFCLAGEEMLLIYEFVPNKSLNYFLFDAQKQGELKWSTRYDIIKGIARGVLYLHEDSRPRIIHRDLKSGNILLDANMNPKIADFGLARIFKVEQTMDDTSRVVGTYGYMAPEYAMHGRFSVKSDVYSFGVLLLEIVSGKKISSKFHPSGDGDLITYARTSYTNGEPLEFMDPTLNDSYSREEVMRCIHLGLLCAQENANERPTMSTVVLMLNSDSTTSSTMPTPQLPRTFYNSSSSTESSLISSRLGVHSTTNNTSESSVSSNNQVTISEMHPR